MAQIKVNQEMYAIIIKRLIDEPQTTEALIDATGMHKQTLYSLMRCFRKHKIAYISDYEPDTRGRDAFPVFSFGKGKDKKPYRMSGAEKAKRYRERRKLAKEQAALQAVIKGEEVGLS